jgi:hypothetical protein
MVRRRTDDLGRVIAGAGGEDGVDDVNGVLDARFAVDREPSFQCDLAVVTYPAAADHDRCEVRRVLQGHLELVPCHIVISDGRYGKAVAGGQPDGQLAEPRSGKVLAVTLAASKVFQRRPDVIGTPAQKLLVHRDHAVTAERV